MFRLFFARLACVGLFCFPVLAHSSIAERIPSDFPFREVLQPSFDHYLTGGLLSDDTARDVRSSIVKEIDQLSPAPTPKALSKVELTFFDFADYRHQARYLVRYLGPGQTIPYVRDIDILAFLQDPTLPAEFGRVKKQMLALVAFDLMAIDRYAVNGARAFVLSNDLGEEWLTELATLSALIDVYAEDSHAHAKPIPPELQTAAQSKEVQAVAKKIFGNTPHSALTLLTRDLKEAFNHTGALAKFRDEVGSCRVFAQNEKTR